jgi:uncharacterized protein YdcH (DUF465 family)
MQPFPIEKEPQFLIPCRSLRGRNEVETRDAVNARHVELWQTDAPALQFDRRDTTAMAYFLDTQPIQSRQYKEDMKSWYSYKTPQGPSKIINTTQEVNRQLSDAYAKLQGIDQQIQSVNAGNSSMIELRKTKTTLQFQLNSLPANDPRRARLQQDLDTTNQQIQQFQNTGANGALQTLRQQRLTVESEIGILQQQLYTLQLNTLADNPYFTKYDVASDPRNVVRELRSVVSEDKVDRGVRESRSLLKREFQHRWVPEVVAEQKGYDTLEAYEMMRPKLTDMSFNYRGYRPPASN